MSQAEDLSNFQHHLDAILDLLDQAAPRDPIWDELSSFAVELPKIIADRQRQLELLKREEARRVEDRQKLQNSLDEIDALPDVMLQFFGVAYARQWKSEMVPEEELPNATKLVAAFSRIIEEYQEIQEESRKSVAARRNARPRLSTLEEEFELVIEDLDAIFRQHDSAESGGSTVDANSGNIPLADVTDDRPSGERGEVPAIAESSPVVKPGSEPTQEELPDEAVAKGAKEQESSESETGAHAIGEDDASIDKPESEQDPVTESPDVAKSPNSGSVLPATEMDTLSLPNMNVVADEAGTTEIRDVSVEPLSDRFPIAPARKSELVERPGNWTLQSNRDMGSVLWTPDVVPPMADGFHNEDISELIADAESLDVDAWTEVQWELIKAGDVAGAYWVSRSLSVRHDALEMPLPGWLLAAVQGAWWLPSSRGALVHDLSAIAHAHTTDTIRSALNRRFAAIAAGLSPALLAPATHLGTWLTTDPRLPQSFNQIIDTIQTFSHRGQAVYRDDVLVIRGEDRRHETIERLAEEATRWLDEAPARRTKFGRANNVWMSWTRNGGPLREMMKIVAKNDEKFAENLELRLAQWRDRGTETWIDRTDAQLLGISAQKVRQSIMGSPRNRLLEQAEQAVQRAEDWLAAIRSTGDKSGWRLDQIKKLVDQISEVKDEAADALAVAETTASGQMAPAVVRLLRWALHDVSQLLELELPDTKLVSRQQDSFPLGMAPGVYAGLGFRLFWLAEANIPDDFKSDWPQLTEIAPILRHTVETGRTLQGAFEKWQEQEDYRFTPAILQNLPDSSAMVEQMEGHQKAINRSQKVLSAMTMRTGDAVEQAMVDGIISDAEHSQLAAEIQSIDASNEIQNFRALKKKLHAIEQRLHKHRRKHLAHQRERWNSIAERLEAQNLDPEKHAQITEFMSYVLEEREDIIVVDERLARLEELLDTGALPPIDEFEVKVDRDAYREFVSALDGWEDDAHRINLSRIARYLRRGRYDNALAFRDTLPRPRELEVAEALDNWSQLKSTPLGNRSEVLKKVITIVRYLGFTFNVPATRAFEWKENGKDWVHLSASITAGNQSPVPQFGSNQPETFDVLCLWERPGVEVIGSHLHNLKLSFNNVVVLYLGRLMKRHRITLMHYAREHSLSLAVMDELLLLFLAGERESRLRTFLRCALPLASVNPYMETGPVPSEMFFGRVAEQKSLQETSGYALVYGGRQLGKSALLQQVEREFHSPENNRYVLREDIKPIGDPLSHQDDPELIWQRLRAGLNGMGLLGGTSATTQKKISAQIRSMMEANPQRRLLVLFDEADNFLAADIKRNFEIVSQLKTLMDDTQRRFKVVFTGLHNVQRYEGIPNQPLAHLPRLPVGPLDPSSAQQLIREPLEALGFRFPEGDDTPVLSILAYTNYHPGLIQLFCQSLLHMMYQKRPRSLGPFIITRDDVESVYRQREVQEDIRRRFEWTLALDPRYKALTQIIVLDQIQDRDGYSKTYRLDDLLALGQAFWSQAFQSSKRDEFRGYLDEMVELGVLVRNEDGRYRLRSPNLVRLMGSEEDIYGALQEVTSRTIHPTLVPDSHHASLGEDGRRYSPFTHQQSRVLNAKRHGVGLIFGSRALGIDLAAEAIKAHFVPAGTSGKVISIQEPSPSREAFTRRLRQFVDENDQQERLIAYHLVQGGVPESTAQQVEAAFEFCAQLRRRRQWLRVLFIFDAVATQNWVELPSDVWEKLEERADVTVTLQQWDGIGVAQRLKQQGKIDSERTVNCIMNAVHGWPLLLDQLADQWGKNEDVLPACERFQQEMDGDNSLVVNRFAETCGWNIDQPVRQVLTRIGHEELFPEEMLIPDFLGTNLSQEECDAIVTYLQRVGLIKPCGADVCVDPLVKRLLIA